MDSGIRSGQDVLREPSRWVRYDDRPGISVGLVGRGGRRVRQALEIIHKELDSTLAHVAGLTGRSRQVNSGRIASHWHLQAR